MTDARGIPVAMTIPSKHMLYDPVHRHDQFHAHIKAFVKKI